VRGAIRDLGVVLGAAWLARVAFVVAIGDAHSLDVDFWRTALAALDQGRNPYETGVLNWPPLWLVVIAAVDAVAGFLGVAFWTALRVYLVLVESALVVTLYVTLLSFGADRAAVRRALLVGIALNPVAIILVCQHGNSDVQVGLLVTLAVAALGAVLVTAAFSLLDVRTLKTFYQVDRREFALSLLATLGVATVGVVPAILVAVILALLRFVRLVSRPKVEILGSVPGLPGLHSIDRHPNAATIPGLVLFRFNAPIVFFNAPFFKRSVLETAEAAGPALKWFVIDMIPVTMIDITGVQAAADVIETLRARGVVLIAAGRETEWRLWAQSRQLKSGYRSFPTLRAAFNGYRRENRSPAVADAASGTNV